MAGSHMGLKIVDTPLNLKVFGPLLHDLTHIDLPGIIVSNPPGGNGMPLQLISAQKSAAMVCYQDAWRGLLRCQHYSC